MLRKNEPRSFVYGPVPSRRLGYSLGVDILPYKTCSMNCVYCQLGRTPRQTTRRARFFPAEEILAQIREAIGRSGQVDCITFSGSGEPTLNTEIGRLIREIKKITTLPVVVLTNSSLLTRQSVRRALRAADIVVPSLDAATESGFRKVNRPIPSLTAQKVIRGLADFRREFKGRLWLEVMLVRGINDSPADIAALKKAIDRIHPDKVQLNTVVRPPAENLARSLTRVDLEKIRKKLGPLAEVVADFKRKPALRTPTRLRQAILAMIRRRPVSLKDMTASLGRSSREIRSEIDTLLRWGRVRRSRHKGTVYYQPGESHPPAPFK
jgi:wyosine [tRNA(Phe)-imidazoG37] synthetase (radical SAM superfamily)